MNSQSAKSMNQTIGRVLVIVAGLVLLAYFSSGSVRTAASRAVLHAIAGTRDWLRSSQLVSLEQQLAVDRQQLVAALDCRKELQEQIRQLVGIRDDAIVRRDAVHQRLSPLLAQLRSSLGQDAADMGARDRARAQELLARQTDLGREIADSEDSIRQLTTSLSDLYQRIRQVRQHLSTQERELRLQRHSFEAESSRRELMDRMQSLEAANGTR